MTGPKEESEFCLCPKYEYEISSALACIQLSGPLDDEIAKKSAHTLEISYSFAYFDL